MPEAGLDGTLLMTIEARLGIWRRHFHRREYFLTQTNTQANALTNALPQLEHLWQIPSGYGAA